MARRKRKHCPYYTDGYCFWNDDSGRVCDTDDGRFTDGYCPQEDDDRYLEKHKAFWDEDEYFQDIESIIDEMDEKE